MENQVIIEFTMETAESYITYDLTTCTRDIAEQTLRANKAEAEKAGHKTSMSKDVLHIITADSKVTYRLRPTNCPF